MSLLEELSKNGVPYLLLAIAYVALYGVFNLFVQSEKDRLDDLKNVITANTAQTKELKDVIITLKDAILTRRK